MSDQQQEKGGEQALEEKEEKRTEGKDAATEFGAEHAEEKLAEIEKKSSPEREEKKVKGSREKIAQAVAPKGGAGKSDVGSQAKEIADLDDADQQVEKLVKLAQQKDPIVAIKIAKHLDDNYVLDQLHDELLEDKIRKVLVEKGLLKEE